MPRYDSLLAQAFNPILLSSIFRPVRVHNLFCSDIFALHCRIDTTVYGVTNFILDGSLEIPIRSNIIFFGSDMKKRHPTDPTIQRYGSNAEPCAAETIFFTPIGTGTAAFIPRLNFGQNPIIDQNPRTLFTFFIFLTLQKSGGKFILLSPT